MSDGRGVRRVLFIHSSSGHYGADRQLRLLALGVDRERFHPLALLPFEGPLARELRADGVEVFTGPLAVLRREHLTPAGLAALAGTWSQQSRALIRLLETQRVDIVHANTSVIVGARRAAAEAGASYVVHVREIYPPTPLAWPLHRRELLQADRVLCVSEATRAALGSDAAHVRVVHDGLAVQPQRAPRPACRLALGVPSDRLVVAVLGRISSWKGQDVLVRALAEPGMRTLGAYGVIAGDVWPGQEHHEQRLRALASRCEVEERLRLAGFRDDIETVYGAADIVVVPSTRPDPLPNAALEAAAAGCCVVAADHGGLPEIVRDKVSGRLFPPGDHAALSDVLSELAADPAARNALGAAARLDVRARFAPSRLLRRVEGIYDELG